MTENNINTFYKYIPYFFLALLLFYVYNLTNSKRSLEDRFKKQKDLYESITDSLHTYKSKDSLNVAFIKVMETDRAKDFLEIKNLTGSNLKLQNLIESQGKDIKNLRTALLVATETQYVDTTRDFYPIGGDTIIFSESVLIDSISNNWIKGKWGFKKGKSIFQIKTFDEFSIVIKDSKKGQYAEVTNNNPYSSTKDMRVFNVATPKQKKRGFGYSIGVAGHYGYFNRQFDVGPYIGIGINGNLFEW